MAPLTINVPITFTDAQLAQIRGAAPGDVPGSPTDPAPGQPELPLDPPAALHFGYYGAPTDSENVDHTSFTFAPGWDGSGLPLTRPTVLFAPSGESLLPALRQIQEQGGLHHIIALYPQDEPAENGLNEQQTVAKFEAARYAARQVGLNPPPPIMVCYGKQGTPGITNADIIGLDWYEHGPQRIDLPRAGQKRFYVCGAADPWREDVGEYARVALDDPQAWGVVVFIWLDQWGGTQYNGVRSNGMVGMCRDAYQMLRGAAPPVVTPGYPAPNEPFDEGFYLSSNPDVVEAIRAGYFVSGWHHYDTNGRYEGREPRPPLPVIEPPVPGEPEPPPVLSQNGWHGDFRLRPITNEAKNFNWLMENFGANVAWNYLMVERDLLTQFRSEADAIWVAGESSRVINHYSNQGKYAPPEFNDPGRRICNVKLGVFSYDMGKKKITLPFYS